MKYLTTKQAARILNVTHRNIRYHVQAGHIINAKRCGCERNNWLVSEEEVLGMSKIASAIFSGREI